MNEDLEGKNILHNAIKPDLECIIMFRIGWT